MASGPSSAVFLLYGGGEMLSPSSGVIVGLLIREGGEYAEASRVSACQSLILNHMHMCFSSVAPADRFTYFESSFESSIVKLSILKSIHEEESNMGLT